MPVGLQLQFVVPSVALDYDKKQTTAAIRKATNEVAKTARSLVRATTGSGRQYGQHQASAPGEPPVKLSGALAASIRTSTRQRGQQIIGRIIDAAQSAEGAPYPRFLSVGAVGGGRGAAGQSRSHRKRSFLERKSAASGRRILAPRPFLETALENQHSVIEKLISDAVQADIKLVIHAP